MRTGKIIALMHGEPEYDKKTLAGLSKITGKYPYFQTAHLLYTLNLFHLEDAHFLHDLRKTAIYLNDRRKLFFLVENRFFDSGKIAVLQQEIPQNSESVFNRIDSFLSENTGSFLSENEELADEAKEIPDSPVVSADYISYYLSDIREEDTEASKPLQFQGTIDRFLEKDEISPIKIELKKPEKTEEIPAPAAEPVDDGDFFSETLAKIYIKQRKYDKALEIIRKIVLFYPEKSSYFADQIQMLEDLIINKNKTE